MRILQSLNPENASNSKTVNLVDFPKNIVVFSHLRWDFVFQRPQHLLTRFSRSTAVFFIEEPVFDATDKSFYSFSKRGENIWVILPHIYPDLKHEEVINEQKALFDNYMENKKLTDYGFWYYTPMALEYSRKHLPQLVVYDCMDELSAFKFAPASLKALEHELLNVADVVFTGGQSLYEAKKNQHSNIHAFPSSIEKEHFTRARQLNKKRDGNAGKPVLKLGFYGVIDERLDIGLLKGIADARPEWELVIIGPVVKIDAALLPKNENIHYLGPKSYQDLPLHLAEWDIALIPFLLNESTRFISPTKTPEYLAAGLPVISTPIADVVNPYGKNKLVSIGSSPADFIASVERELQQSKTDKEGWLKKVDAFLALNSWDKTYQEMLYRMNNVVRVKFATPLAL